MADISRSYDFSAVPANTPIKGAEVDAELDALYARINDLPPEALQSAVAEALGLTQPGTARRGKSIIADEGARTNVSYGALANGPDQVANVVLPGDGLIVVLFKALWKESVADAARAAIFVGANQLKTGPQSAGIGAPTVQEAGPQGSQLNTYHGLSSGAGGLGTNSGGAVGDDVTTGQTVSLGASPGGPCYIFAAAGTYTVSVQFKASSGSVTAKQRKLWVWTLAF